MRLNLDENIPVLLAPSLTTPFRVTCYSCDVLMLEFWYGWSERPYAL